MHLINFQGEENIQAFGASGVLGYLMSGARKKRKVEVDHGEKEKEDLFFKGIVALFVEKGIQPRRLQVLTYLHSAFLFLFFSYGFWELMLLLRFFFSEVKSLETLKLYLKP